MKKTYILLLLALIVISFIFLENRSAPESKPSNIKIKIGIIAPLSGDYISKGMMGIKGIKIAQQLIPYLNNGDEIEWVAKDDQDKPEQSIQALKTLIEIDKVAAVIMLSGSDSVLATAKIADQYKIPILSLFASHPDITTHSSFVNQFSFDDTFQASVAALFIRDELMLEKAAIITQSDNVHLYYLANQFALQFKAAEGTITDNYDLIKTPKSTVDMLQEIKSKDPQILYLPVSLQHLFKIKLALAEIDWEPTIMVSDGILASVRAQKIYPLSLMEGVLAIDAFSYDTEFTSFGDKLLRKANTLGINHTQIGTYGALGMEGYAFLIHVMNQCSIKYNLSICINNRIRSTTKFEGIKGFIAFDAKGKAHRSLVVNKLKGEAAKFLVQVY